jgi:UPF0716 protein FxsA
MILLAALSALILIPLAEIYLIIKVGEAIGWAATLGLLVLDAMLGSLLMRSQGRAVWRAARSSLREGRLPAREVLDGALVMVGGAFLIAPGFLTDALGAVLLVPVTRTVIRKRITARFVRGLASGDRRSPGRSHRGSYDVEGTAVDVEGQLGQLEAPDRD